MRELADRIARGEPEQRLKALLESVLHARGSEPLVLSAIQSCLDDPHPGLRQAAMDVLSRLATTRGAQVAREVGPRIVALCSDASAKVRREAAASLALLFEGEDLPGREQAILTLLADADPEVRQEAAAAAGDLGQRSALEILAALLADADQDVRFEAAIALASLGDGRARAPLQSALAADDRRLPALEALRKLGDPACLPELEKLSKRWLLPWVDALAIAATRYALGDHAQGALVISKSYARRREERAYALALLGSHKIAEGLPRLREVAADPNDPLRETAAAALQPESVLVERP